MERQNLVLSIFPGFDLLGRAFEEEGYAIFRGPDILWGGDIERFHAPGKVFAGLIGGPPCKIHSTTIHLGVSRSPTRDYTPDFLRVFRETQPRWAVMENVRGVVDKRLMPTDWACLRLRDWDCGGLTHRIRYFWVWPATLILVPPKRPGNPEYSVLASSWKNHNGTRVFRGHSNISLERAAELQGFPELIEPLRPLGRKYAVALLGNGVPKAMGLYMARAIRERFGQ